MLMDLAIVIYSIIKNVKTIKFQFYLTDDERTTYNG